MNALDNTTNNVSNRFSQLLGTFEVDLGIQHHFSDGLYAKEIHIPEGYIVGSHAHTYDHLSLLASGEVIVKTDDLETKFIAPAMINIKKHCNHEIYAVKDAVWFCIHATEETNESKVDEVLIMKEGV